MSQAVFLFALLSTVGIAAFTVIKVTRLFAHRPQSLPAEALERLDFTERLLASTREERRIGG